jgi:hypothetical protein
MEQLLRIYDDHSDVPQPSGPVRVDVPEGATDEQVIAKIQECANPERPFRITFSDGAVGGLRINPGWKLLYLD